LVKPRPVAVRLAGVGVFKIADAGKPDCYGGKCWALDFDLDLHARWIRRRRTRRQGARPSAGVVEGDERQEAASRAGHGRRSDGRDSVPSERRRSEGSPKDPQPGANGLPTFPKESRSPVRGETLIPNHHENGYTPDPSVTRRRGASFRALTRGAWERSSSNTQDLYPIVSIPPTDTCR